MSSSSASSGNAICCAQELSINNAENTTARTDKSRERGRRCINTTILRDMGMDPTRQHQRRPFDYAFVIGAIIVGIALVSWAFFG